MSVSQTSTPAISTISAEEKALKKLTKIKLIDSIFQLKNEIKNLELDKADLQSALNEAKIAREETFITPSEYLNDLKLRARKHNYEFSELVADISKGVETLKSQIKKVQLPDFV